MKALTIKQPWAQLIVDGIKPIENRTWKTNFRGRVYVHAGAKQPKAFSHHLTTDQLADFHSYIDQDVYGCYATSNLLGDWTLSAIIGEVDIIDCVINHQSIWAEQSFIPEIWNWVLANPVKYDQPILNVKGALSFWQPDLSLFNESNN